MRTARLALEDGSVFTGQSFGAELEADGEVVFNTSMTGYQEICTDPSYRGQMVVMTYPLIGNYGVTAADDESRRPWVAALIVRECYDDYSNWRAEGELAGYLRRHGIPGLCGVDTRAITRRLRTVGTMRAILSTDPSVSSEELAARAKAVTPLSEKAVVAETSIDRKRQVPFSSTGRAGAPPIAADVTATGLRVAVLDCGLKENIVRSLVQRGIDATVFPYDVTAETVLEGDPNGVVICNGPGDPAVLPQPVTLVRDLIERTEVPIFGICLGHQILARAIGAETGRLKFGHHGANHPVRDLATGRVHITSQNHEFQVLADTIPENSGFYVSMQHLNDGSVEGLAHRERPIFSVQYHPEGSPGPQDNQYLFDRFVQQMRERKRDA